ncbi:DUF421 domain-containing protein, partial [Acinetobacter lactucae]|uniref:DUF421 domain-containing protein n=1 Tax=Acinetobacter lactucae TaxID=1785128 RepID=UPI001580F187
MDFINIFIGDTTWNFVLEVLVRCSVMFIIIISFLRLSGKRGVRQLSLFELAIILCLGSAAGDPMFTEDIPIAHALVVFVVILFLYRFATWSMVKHKKFEDLLEGKALCIVKDGLVVYKDFQKQSYSHDEFFSEMRQQHVEHLGQVRAALLESDGILSLLYFEDVKWGLPLFPDAYSKADILKPNTFYSCMKCGETKILNTIDQECTRCKHHSWAESLKTRRLG